MSRSPISWIGGKYVLSKKIIPFFPDHTRYIEPFGGAMHILYRKPPVPLEVYNDVDSRLVNFFRTVQSQPEAIYDRLAFTLYSREWYEQEKIMMYDETASPVERAAAFYTVNRQCFGGKINGVWGIDYHGMRAFFDFRERLEEGHNRLKNVYIEHMDFRKLIPKYDSADALFYCDPPYIFNEARGAGKLYNHELMDTDHMDLVELLKNIKGRFVLSGYANALYDCFDRISLGDVAMHIHGGPGVKEKTRKEEFIWKNF
jgi:DNA adenine methylase